MPENRSSFELPYWLLITISWLLGFYFLISFHYSTGFPRRNPSSLYQWLPLIISIILFLLPFFTRIRIGNVIELEREISNVQESVDDFKEETRQSFALITSTITTISNVSSNVQVVNLPGNEEYIASQNGLQQFSTQSIENVARDVRQILVLEDETTILPLVKTRILIEQLLRKILNKRQKSNIEGP